MAGKPKGTASRAQQHAPQVSQLLKRCARHLSADGWNPTIAARSIAGVLSVSARELWPVDEQTRVHVHAFALAELSKRMARRFAHENLDAWEHDMYREPEDVVALVASDWWPWPTMIALSPQTTTVEAFMTLQRLNVAGITVAELVERSKSAFPRAWLPEADELTAIASQVSEHAKTA